jgi:hypothetical protein
MRDSEPKSIKHMYGIVGRKQIRIRHSNVWHEEQKLKTENFPAITRTIHIWKQRVQVRVNNEAETHNVSREQVLICTILFPKRRNLRNISSLLQIHSGSITEISDHIFFDYFLDEVTGKSTRDPP